MLTMTNTVHPPAGATALLCATSPDITALGWWTLALVVLGCMLMLVSALLLNNLIRLFPIYWWTPANLAQIHKEKWGKGDPDLETTSQAVNEEKKETEMATSSSASEATDVERHGSHQISALSEVERSRKREQVVINTALEHEIVIRKDHIIVPDWMDVNDWDLQVLEILQSRLKQTS